MPDEAVNRGDSRSLLGSPTRRSTWGRAGSASARRRLRDLPVGESHHLATTVPPETWDRVVVVQWPDLLADVPAQEKQAAEQLGSDTCGLAMEHLLQVTYRPVMTARRRSTAGGWKARNLNSSRSRGAVNSSRFPELFKAVRDPSIAHHLDRVSDQPSWFLRTAPPSVVRVGLFFVWEEFGRSTSRVLPGTSRGVFQGQHVPHTLLCAEKPGVAVVV